MISAYLLVNLTWVAAGASGLALIHWIVTRSIEIFPFEPAVRVRLRRNRTLLGLLLLLLFMLWTADVFFGESETAHALSLLVVFVGFFIAAARPLKDYLAGVALVAEGAIKKGDQVRIGELRGRVLELATRGISLETTDGDRAMIPYSSAQEASIVRLSGSGRGTIAHSFLLPRESNTPETRRRIVALVQGHHFAAVGRLPDFQLDAAGLEVTLHALDAAFVLEIEQAVRTGLESDASKASSAAPDLESEKG